MALPPPDPASTCLVTGASAGIGADIARELAARGHGVALVARREDRLRELAGELERGHGVRAEVVAGDVADAADRERVMAEIADRGLAVEVLVNNAGFGSAGAFQGLDPDREVMMVRTNVEAVVALCGAYVAAMVERGRGAVLNLASVAGFHPLPRQATYSATKAFVLAFTEALDADLSGTGVRATAVCPGPVKSEFEEQAGIDGAFDALPSFTVLSSAQTARAAVRAVERGKRSEIPGVTNVLAAYAGRFAPRTVSLPVLRAAYLPRR
ncbi:MAG: SDR family oxidoreductase [Actinomycetota bacterium]|nr:SDR family oxidoreductase [Actinomycetota bacterium]